MLGQFGETDHAVGFSDVPTVLKFKAAAKEAGLNFTLHMWEAGHAFMNQSIPKAFNDDIAQKALLETVEFFRQCFTA